jgi:hypothetical protein
LQADSLALVAELDLSVLLNVHSRFGAGDTGLQIRVRLNQGSTGMVMTYAVVNDNATNDGYVVMGNMMNGGRGMGMMN